MLDSALDISIRINVMVKERHDELFYTTKMNKRVNYIEEALTETQKLMYQTSPLIGSREAATDTNP
ncbi:hypothetical protein ANSO36C_02670 [Nostoc cf. commune SO-36]|uniref:Uncharacterized protein n=2 Tax=Nostoc commune TaxID=1178 RepID=A0ABM7YUZ9_NOSCO|nr:hypothetical protein ANSO36C_02670 [Nostoc cf. commune SO-36]